MPPRKRRPDLVEQSLRAIARMSGGTVAGRVESASPARRLPDARIGQRAGSRCPCPVSVRTCEPTITSTEQTLTWTQDSGQTEGETFDTGTSLRLMHPPDNNGSNQPWQWFEAAHNYGKGTIHDFFVLDHVITAGEVSALTSPAGIPSSGLILHYPMNESSGTTAIDTSGGGHNGTYNGGVTLNGSYATFDGVNDYLSVALPYSGTATKTLTFGMWTNFDTSGAANRTLLDRGTQTGVQAIKIVPDATYSSLNNFTAEIWGCDSGSGGYDLAHGPLMGAGEQLVLVSFDINNLGQNSNSLGPRPKIRVWYGSSSGFAGCTLDSSDQVLFAGASVQLPAAADAQSMIYSIKNISTSVIAVVPASGEQIDDAPAALLSPLDGIEICSDGSNWWILSGISGEVALSS